MKKNDQEILAQLYEEGFWDRVKASASGVAGGVKGFLGGQGYAKSAQSSKLSSLMRGKLASILDDIKKLESDMAKYSKDQAAPPILQKIQKIKSIINQFNQ